MTMNKTPRTIKATAAAIVASFKCSGMGGFKSIDGLKPAEIAARLRLDIELMFKALDRLEADGHVLYERTGKLGCVGYFRTVKGLVFHMDPELVNTLSKDRAFELAAG